MSNTKEQKERLFIPFAYVSVGESFVLCGKHPTAKQGWSLIKKGTTTAGFANGKEAWPFNLSEPCMVRRSIKAEAAACVAAALQNL